eukprot:Hpha_TRINITY_DN14994_c0_g1::TRINITY_DN14994_c0_g1_i3::g.144641::m.144641
MGGKDADSAVQYAAGEQVWVFYRFEHGQGLTLPDEYESYFPVQTSACALKAPRTSKTDGWMRAVVAEEYPSPSGKPSEFVRLRPLHRLWGNRKGSFVDLSIPSQAAGRFIRARVACVRRDPPPPPSFSFLVLRWGIWTTAHDGDGEWGGWGQYGSCVCDKYIKGFFTRAFERMGATYEVLTCFVHQSADIRRLQPESLVARLATHQDGASGKSAALYYLWPVAWLDGHGGDLSADDLAGYVEREALLGISLLTTWQGTWRGRPFWGSCSLLRPPVCRRVILTPQICTGFSVQRIGQRICASPRNSTCPPRPRSTGPWC